MSLAAKEKIDNLLKWLMSQVNSYPVSSFNLRFVFLQFFYLVDFMVGFLGRQKLNHSETITVLISSRKDIAGL